LASLSASERALVSSTSWLNRTERLVRVCERVCLCRVVMLSICWRSCSRACLLSVWLLSSGCASCLRA
jgi:hypothetical protein